MATRIITEQHAEIRISAGNDPAHITTDGGGVSSPIPVLTPLMLDEVTRKLVVQDGQKAGSTVGIPVLSLKSTETALMYYELGAFAAEVTYWPESVGEHKEANTFAGSALNHATPP